MTYLPMAQGFLYLVVVIDWHSRYVVSWRLSNTLEAGFCAEVLTEALARGRPKVFDQARNGPGKESKITEDPPERLLVSSAGATGLSLNSTSILSN